MPAKLDGVGRPARQATLAVAQFGDANGSRRALSKPARASTDPPQRVEGVTSSASLKWFACACTPLAVELLMKDCSRSPASRLSSDRSIECWPLLIMEEFS